MISVELTYALLSVRKALKKLKAHPNYRSDPASINGRTGLIIALRKNFPPSSPLSSKEIERSWRHDIIEALLGYSIESQNDLTYSETHFLWEVVDEHSKYFTGELRAELQTAIETTYSGKAWAILDPDEAVLAMSNLRKTNDAQDPNGSTRGAYLALNGTGAT